MTGIGAHIYSPVLTISYSDSMTNNWVDDKKKSVISYVVEGRYTMNFDAFQAKLYSCFIVAVVLSGLIFMLRYMNWNNR